MKNVLRLENLGNTENADVGNLALSLGKINDKTDIPVLPGFTTTGDAYRNFMRESRVRDKLEKLLDGFDGSDVSELHRVGRQARAHIQEADMPKELRNDILNEYKNLEENSKREEFSAMLKADISEEHRNGSEQFLNISDRQELLKAVKKCFGSYFSNDAIYYREENGISHFDQSVSVVIQEMSRSDIGSSGRLKTKEPANNLITVTSSYGNGEREDEDEFNVFKKNLAIIEKKLGEKKFKTVREGEELVEKEVPMNDREKYSITDNQVKELCKYALAIDEVLENSADIKWSLDGHKNKIYIEEVDTEAANEDVIYDHSINEQADKLLEAKIVQEGIASGKARLMSSPNNIDKFEAGEILVADSINSEWEPMIEKASGIILNNSTNIGVTSIDIPILSGTRNATSVVKDGEKVTLDCLSSKGRVLKGEVDYTVEEYNESEVPETETEIKLDVVNSEEAIQNSELPLDGVGLANIEDMISEVGKHPLHLIEEGRKDDFIGELVSEIGKIGAAFYPRKVDIKLSDFSSENYKNLEAGEEHEDEEENPLLGLRGSSRHTHERFEEAFRLECEAVRKCIDKLGLDNITVVVPFCRTVQEGREVRAKMKEYGLDQGDLDVHVMVETPANVIQAEELTEVFDGVIIGTKNLTQLTLGVDRENEELKELFDERDPAVKKSVQEVVRKAHEKGKPVGINGDAPSIHDEYTEFLVKNRVDSISVTPDKAIDTVKTVSEYEYEIEFSGRSPEDIGSAAGEVYDILNEHGKATANRLVDHVDEVFNPKVVNQALGWLAKEDKIEVEVRKNGETKYKLD